MKFKRITEEYDFQQAVEPAMKWIAENGNPHMKLLIEDNKAELVSGEFVHKTDEFLVD